MEFQTHHESDLRNLLQWRRDVRHFSTRPIEPEVLRRLEASVDMAPSVGNSRPWRIVRVQEEKSRLGVIRCFEEQNHAASCEYDDAARNEYLALKLAGLKEAPVHLAFFTEPDPAAGRGLGRRTMPETLSYSTIMAIHTFWLYARTLNVGVGWVSILDPEAVKTALDVPVDWKLVGYLCLGYPQEEHTDPELVRHDWQQRRCAEDLILKR